jgi:hypothetical protein
MRKDRLGCSTCDRSRAVDGDTEPCMSPERRAYCGAVILVFASILSGTSRGQGQTQTKPAGPSAPEQLPAPRYLPDPSQFDFFRGTPYEREPSEGSGLFDPLRRPIETPPSPADPAPVQDPGLFQTPYDPPVGFTGPSSVLPRDTQVDSHFVPIEDRWRIGFSPWDRYGRGHPMLDDYPYAPSGLGIFGPFGQNMIKGDYPIWGQNTFLDLSFQSFSFIEGRNLPTQTTPFESTSHPNQFDFFGRNDQLFYFHNFVMIVDLFHGDAGFKQPDWRVKLTPIINLNYLTLEELAQVNPNVEKGTSRARGWVTLQEWFVEKKIADLSPNFDFVSVRAGSQPFNSDFRGFIFNDVNRAIRIFGTANANRDQFNLAYFRQQEKDTNSLLNSFNDRGQDIVIANYFRQDFFFPGYTSQWSFHFNHDGPSFHFDRNNFLVRPDPVGAFTPHTVYAAYLGWAGDGHIGRFNISHAFYEAIGYDTLNPLANQPQNINAQFGAIELSYDRDYVRFRMSGMFASGDSNPNNSHATGFDSILDFPNFAGGQFTYWQRQAVPIFGVNLTQRFSFLPDLRSSKVQGQSNFVNPGFGLYNLGFDVEITPRLKSINNCNFMWFDKTLPLETFLFQEHIHHFIGADISTGLEYRPLLSNNILLTYGFAVLLPGQGFKDIYSRFMNVANPLISTFVQTELNF